MGLNFLCCNIEFNCEWIKSINDSCLSCNQIIIESNDANLDIGLVMTDDRVVYNSVHLTGIG